MGLSRPTWETK